MVLRVYLALFLQLFEISLFGQTKEIIHGPSKLIRFNAFGLADPVETNLSFGFEYRDRKNWAICSDAAWIFQSMVYQHVKSTNGLIFRPAFRYYYSRSERSYLELELHYKLVVNRIQDWLGKGCVNGVPAYEQFTMFRYRKQVVGTNFKIGYQGRISKSGKLWYEMYFGLGLRRKFEDILNEPNSCYNNTNININDEVIDGKKIYPAFPWAIRVLYKLQP